MTLVISRGQAASAGETWTPTKQNNSTVPQITVDTQTLVGRNTSGNGSIEELAPAVARTLLGLGSMALNSLSVLESKAVNVNQTAAGVGQALVFNAVGAPTLNLGPGKWVLLGTLCVRDSNATPTEVKGEFGDNGGTNTFGGGASLYTNSTERAPMTIIGYKVVPSGTFDVFFKTTPVNAGAILNVGSAGATNYAATMLAVRLEGP